MTKDASDQIAVWDTSAVNRLAGQNNVDELIARMKVGYCHSIPMYIFDEIASTQLGEKRKVLLNTCRKLMGSSSWSLKSPVLLIQDAVHMFFAHDRIDWKSLLSAYQPFEEAIASGEVFDDGLAIVQREQLKNGLVGVEDFFVRSKTNYEVYFCSGSDIPTTLDEVITKSISMGIVLRDIHRWCELLLGQPVNFQFAERFAKAFPPVVAVTYAFLIAHYDRNKFEPTAKPAGAIDLLAAAYLPVCHKFISDDQDQQKVLRDVVKYCPLATEVVWFSGDFVGRFSPPQIC